MTTWQSRDKSLACRLQDRCTADLCCRSLLGQHRASPDLTLCPHSSPVAQQLSFLHNGLLSNLYLHTSDCPVPLLQWLFQVRNTDMPPGGRSMAASWPAGRRDQPLTLSLPPVL